MSQNFVYRLNFEKIQEFKKCRNREVSFNWRFHYKFQKAKISTITITVSKLQRKQIKFQTLYVLNSSCVFFLWRAEMNIAIKQRFVIFKTECNILINYLFLTQGCAESLTSVDGTCTSNLKLRETNIEQNMEKRPVEDWNFFL